MRGGATLKIRARDPAGPRDSEQKRRGYVPLRLCPQISSGAPPRDMQISPPGGWSASVSQSVSQSHLRVWICSKLTSDHFATGAKNSVGCSLRSQRSSLCDAAMATGLLTSGPSTT